MNPGNESPTTDLFSEDMPLDDTGRMHLRGIASWAMIIVVTSVLGYVLSIITLFRPAEMLAPVEGFSRSVPVERNAGGTIITILIGLVINFFLYRFATSSRAAITAIDSARLSSGIRNLKFYFVITSLLLLLALLLVLLVVTSLIS